MKLWDRARGELVASLPHPAAVGCLAFSPDGKTLATGCDDQSVRLWDVETRQPRASLDAHEGAVRALAFSPGGKLLVSACARGILCTWDPARRKRLAAVRNQTGLWGLAFAPNGKTVATGDDQSITLWNTLDLSRLSTLPGASEQVTNVAWSADGRLLAWVAGGSIRLWDIVKGEARGRVPWDGEARSVRFAPDGKHFVVSGVPAGGADRGGAGRLFRTDDQHVVADFTWDKGPIYACTFAPDSQSIVLGGEAGIVSVWRPWLPPPPSLETPAKLQAIAFSPDGQAFATAGGNDNAIQLWDAKLWKRGATFRGHQGPVSGIAFSPDGKLLASVSHDHTVRLWNLATGQEEAVLPGHTKAVTCLAWSSNGQILATGGDDFVVKLWDVSARKLLFAFQGHKATVSGVAFAPGWRASRTDSNASSPGTIEIGDRYDLCLASVGLDGSIRLWDVEGGRAIAVLDVGRPMSAVPGGGRDEMWSVAFSPDGKTLAVGASDGTIHRWSVPKSLWHPDEWKTGRTALRGHLQGIHGLAFSADGNSLASGGDDGTVRLWDPQTGAELLRLEGLPQGVLAVAFSADARTLAGVARDGTVRFWQGAGGQEAGEEKN